MRRRPDVTLAQLRYFVKAATYLSMTKAADELHIAQSAVSAAISQLEQQIGTQLFIRHRARGLALTAAGEEMLHDTRALLAHLDEVLDNATGRVDRVHGTVRLACFVTLTPFVLPRLLSDLGTRHPDLEVEVIETSADAVRTVLRNGTAELALTYDLALGAGVDAEYLGVAAPYVALPPDHRLADRKSIRLTELAEEPMVLLDLPDSRDYFESMLAKAGVTPRIRYRSASYEAVRGLVARGHGFSILNQIPAHRGTYDGGEVSVVPIRDELPGLPIVLARLRSVRSTARARAVADAAREIFRRSPRAPSGPT
ncbi:LysR family transcriptional regulator [Mycolicibacterium smegmatis]|uniref:LysR family transcriptional regulator n=1 Tax=Mycolicibacterium smegmatis TaxID=1772 RepID=UPI000E0535B5|nr:LysR family transcriptional regulator [Mycolicibacterium smegmatis]SUB58016.1 LysR family transcriptional regulator [Mycolicibacterium smegmatis]